MLVMLVALVIYNIIILQTHASLLDGFSKALYPTETLDRYSICTQPCSAADGNNMGSIQKTPLGAKAISPASPLHSAYSGSTRAHDTQQRAH